VTENLGDRTACRDVRRATHPALVAANTSASTRR
jgi:hypothetical protein